MWIVRTKVDGPGVPGICDKTAFIKDHPPPEGLCSSLISPTNLYELATKYHAVFENCPVLQSEERFIASTLVSESANYLLLAAALIAFATGTSTALWPFALVAVAQLVLAGAVLTTLDNALDH